MVGNAPELPLEFRLVDEGHVLVEAQQPVVVLADQGDGCVVIGPDDEEQSGQKPDGNARGRSVITMATRVTANGMNCVAPRDHMSRMIFRDESLYPTTSSTEASADRGRS